MRDFKTSQVINSRSSGWSRDCTTIYRFDQDYALKISQNVKTVLDRRDNKVSVTTPKRALAKKFIL